MAAPPVFSRKEEALAMLGEEFERVGLLTPAAFTIEKQKLPGSQKLAWWHANGPEAESGDRLRGLAYLRTYFRITGGRPLPAGGLKLHKDRVWMDKAVISTLERDGFLAFEPTGHFEPSFVVTEKGRHWIVTGEVLT
jgi:hypothetical protein